MSDPERVWKSGEDVQLLENALADSSVSLDTRKALLKRASTGLFAAGGIGALLAACGGSSMSSSSRATAAAPATTSMSTSTAGMSSSSAGAQIQEIVDTAATAEALAVTYLSAVIKQAPGTPVARFVDVLKAANAEEYDHFKALIKLGAKPITRKFWAPDAFFGPNLSGVFPTLEVAETLFVNAYLIAITTFAKAGKASLARYASEISGVEAQHLALARYAGNKLPNDVGFTDYSITSIDGIVAALEHVGVGFGKQGTAPGKFVSFAPPPPDAVTHVGHTTPA
ncbi:MAG: ferritin-like domain-containing protein [Solirubrobacterales bacterium]|nr:ferritin-like domain-containing protein [Solirubrobacterales bacterium]